MEDKDLMEEMVNNLDDAGKMIFAFFALAILEPNFLEKLREETEKLK